MSDSKILIDMGKPSYTERLYICEHDQVISSYFVAHGSGSNDEKNPRYAVHFSNEPESHKTCLGTFLPLEVYSGKHGTSLRLQGVSPGLNDNAESRNIVMHGADYVSAEYVKTHSQCGNSWGCFAVDNKYIHELIKWITSNNAPIVVHK